MPYQQTTMNFARTFLALQHREWAEYYLDYNGLKLILLEREGENGNNHNNDPTTKVVLSSDTEQVSLIHKITITNTSTTEKFLQELYGQVHRITLFVVKEQGEVADDLMGTRQKQESMLLQASGSISVTVVEKLLKNLRDQYNKLGAKLLHLIQFVDWNVNAITRLLKKHDKRVKSSQRAYEAFLVGEKSRSAIMMTSLRQESTLDALCISLQSAYREFHKLRQEHFGVPALPPSTLGPSGAILTPRLNSAAFLSGSVNLTPLLTRRIKSTRARTKSEGNIERPAPSGQTLLDQMNVKGKQLTNKTAEESWTKIECTNFNLDKDDFIMAQIYSARRTFQQNNAVMNMLAATSLGFEEAPPDIILPGQDQDIKAEYERAAALAAFQRSHRISGILNFVSSFIYMANYLIVVPTVVTYSQKLGADPALSSAIIGMTPFATIFSTIVYSYWTSFSYRTPLLVAALLNVVGNCVYALGGPCNSMKMVLLGRLLCGSGSCRPINRRYIADAYSTADRTAASAHFVAVGCFGMALGPFMGSVLHRFSATSTSPYWQVENAPGWFMAVVWSVYVVFHLLFFVDPPKEDLASDTTKTQTKKGGEAKPLLSYQMEEQKAKELEEIENRVPIWKNAAVMVNFFIYFVEKLLMECVSSSTSILTYYYFQWPGSLAGYYLSFLCFLVLPVNLLVAYLSKTYEDREMMMVMQAVTVVGCFVILRYGDAYFENQYLAGTLMIVVFSNMVEGPNMSLLSKTIPKSWRKGFLNVGLLATEAATLGRTGGDVFLVLCGSGDIENQLNYTFGSMIVLTLFTLWLSWRYYDSLVPTEDKNL